MTDLSSLSDADVEALSKGDMASMSDEGLAHVSGIPEKPQEKGFIDKVKDYGSELGHAAVDALPAVGGVAGGILGTPLDAISGPMGNIAGAALGGYAGTAAKNAINSYINPEHAPKTMTDTLVDPLVGGAEQGLMFGAGEGVAPLVGKALAPVGRALKPVGEALTGGKNALMEYLNKIAENRMAKGMGAIKADYRKLGEDKLREVGRYGLDNKLAGRTGLTGTEAMIDNNAVVQEASMAGRKGIYDKIDAGTPAPQAPKPQSFNPYEYTPESINQPVPTSGASQFNPAEAAEAVNSRAGGFNRQSPLNSGATSQLDKILESIKLRGSKPISMNEAQALQEEIQSAAKFDTTRSTGANDVARDAAAAHREYLNQSAENAAEQVGGSNFKSQLKAQNRQYSMSKRAEELLDKRNAGELGNKTFGLTDTIVGATEATVNPAKAVAAVGLKKTAEKYGNQVTAVTADNLSKIVKATPQVFGKFAKPLSEAAARGSVSLNATDYILQQRNPEYRAQRNKVFGPSEEDQPGDH